VANLLQVQGLRCRFGGLTALDDLSFQVGAGEVVGLFGPHGVDKTATIGAILGSTDWDAREIRSSAYAMPPESGAVDPRRAR